MKPVAGILLFVALVSGVVWFRIGVWNECRSDHSWSYCMVLVSGK